MRRRRVSLQAYWSQESWFGPMAVEVERLGFDGFWVGDHVAGPIRDDSRYPHNASGRPTMVPETPLVDVFCALAAAAATTSRIMLGTNIAVLPIRPPLLTARAASTLQNMSGGRFVLGVGTGWQRTEFEALGKPFENRGARTDEILELLPRLWTGEAVAHDGETCSFGPLKLSPPVIAPIPIAIGGSSPPALRRAARHDGWCGTTGLTVDQTVAQRETIEEERTRIGRSERPFRYWVRAGNGSAAAIEDFTAAGFDDLIIIGSYGTVPASLDEALDKIREAATAAGL